MKKLWILILASCCYGSVFGQQSLSLADALARALANNYNLQIVRNDQQVAHNNNSWSIAGGYPTINFNVSQFNQFALGEATRLQTLTPSLTLNWLLFSGFRVRSTKEKLANIDSLSTTTTQLRVETTVRDVIVAYYGSLMEAERLRLNQQLMDLSRDRYQAFQIRKELGAAVSFDILQAKNDYLSDSLAFLTQRQRHLSSLRLLSFILADTANTLFVLSDKFETSSPEFELANLIDRMRHNNKTLRMQSYAVAMANEDVSIARSTLYPSLSLSTGIDYNWQHIEQAGGQGQLIAMNIEAFSWKGSLSLAWTLFNGGARRRQISNAHIQQHSAQLSLQQTEHSLVNQLTNLVETYDLRRQSYLVALEAEAAAQLNLQMARERYERGAINSFNYRDVQNLYLTTAQARLASVFNLITARVDIMQAIGEIVNQPIAE